MPHICQARLQKLFFRVTYIPRRSRTCSDHLSHLLLSLARAIQEAMPCRAALTLVAGLIIEGVEHAWNGPSLRVAAVPVEGDEGLHPAVRSPGQLVSRPPDPIPVPAGQPCVGLAGSVAQCAALCKPCATPASVGQGSRSDLDGWLLSGSPELPALAGLASSGVSTVCTRAEPPPVS